MRKAMQGADTRAGRDLAKFMKKHAPGRSLWYLRLGAERMIFDEIDRLVQEAEEHSVADTKRRQLRRLRNRLEGLIYVNERVFDRFQEVLRSVDRKRLSDTMTKARAALASDDRTDLEASIFDLNAISGELSDLMLGGGTEAVSE